MIQTVTRPLFKLSVISLSLLFALVSYSNLVSEASLVGSAIAEDSDASEGEKKKKKLPKSGTLSASVSSGGATNAVPGAWGADENGWNGAAPITGSVSRMNPSTWKMFVINESEDEYSVNLSVVQRDQRGTQVKSDSYSYTLKPKQSESRSVSSATNSVSASLELRSFKNLSDKKRAKSKKDVPASTGGDATEGAASDSQRSVLQ